MELTIKARKFEVLASLLVLEKDGICEADVKRIATKVNDAFNELEAAHNGNNRSEVNNKTLVLTPNQIKELARFAEMENQPDYTICYGEIPAVDGLDAYCGLVAYSDTGVCPLKE